jgi:DNA-binding NtrC family response regulator
MQAKLLRVIEQGEFLRVGDTKTQKVDVRIVAATNKKLAEEVSKGNFRQDLYYRLKTVTIKVDPLKNHISDIYLYIERFGLEFTAKNDIPFKGFSSEAIAVMKKHPWPGNIRELKNSVESMIVLNQGARITDSMVIKHLDLDEFSVNPNLPVFMSDDPDKMERELILKQLLFLRQDVNELKQMLVGRSPSVEEPIQPSNPALYLPPPTQSDFVDYGGRTNIEERPSPIIQDDALGELTMEELEHEVIERTLDKFKGNRRKTAQSLNISERTLYRKINDYGIKRKHRDQ